MCNTRPGTKHEKGVWRVTSTYKPTLPPSPSYLPTPKIIVETLKCRVQDVECIPMPSLPAHLKILPTKSAIKTPSGSPLGDPPPPLPPAPPPVPPPRPSDRSFNISSTNVLALGKGAHATRGHMCFGSLFSKIRKRRHHSAIITQSGTPKMEDSKRPDEPMHSRIGCLSMFSPKIEEGRTISSGRPTCHMLTSRCGTTTFGYATCHHMPCR